MLDWECFLTEPILEPWEAWNRHQTTYRPHSRLAVREPASYPRCERVPSLAPNDIATVAPFGRCLWARRFSCGPFFVGTPAFSI